MHVSDEFFDFCSGIIQNFDEIYGPEPEDWINGALGFVRKARLSIFRDYLNELLSANYSDAQLGELYNSTYTELRFQDVRELRDFLGRVRDTINENLQPGAPDSIDLARRARLQHLRDADTE